MPNLGCRHIFQSAGGDGGEVRGLCVVVVEAHRIVRIMARFRFDDFDELAPALHERVVFVKSTLVLVAVLCTQETHLFLAHQSVTVALSTLGVVLVRFAFDNVLEAVIETCLIERRDAGRLQRFRKRLRDIGKPW